MDHTKHWVDWPFYCQNCGGKTQVLTSLYTYYKFGDLVRCKNCYCLGKITDQSVYYYEKQWPPCAKCCRDWYNDTYEYPPNSPPSWFNRAEKGDDEGMTLQDVADIVNMLLANGYDPKMPVMLDDGTPYYALIYRVIPEIDALTRDKVIVIS